MALADEMIRKIRAAAVRQGLADPDLAVAVAMKESSLKPEAWGDRGASLGLFQLQRKAAIDAGIDPERRQDVDLNIEGGVRYLKQKLAQSGGNVEQALRRYNSGTPTFKGLGDPRYVERTMAIRRDLDTPAAFPKYGAVETSPVSSVAGRAFTAVRGALTPARAEAATMTALPLPPEEPPGMAPAAARSQPGAVPLPPEDPPAPAQATPPAVTTLGATTPAATPPAAAPTAATQVDLLGQQEQGRLEAERAVGSPTVTPAENVTALGKMAGATGISTATTAGGAKVGGLLGLPFGPVGVAVGTTLGGMAGAYAGRRANVDLALEEEGPWGDALSVALPGLQGLWGAGKAGLRGLVKSSRGWKALTAADEATAAFRAEEAATQQAAQRAYQEELALRPTPFTTRAQEQARLLQMQRRQTALRRHERGEAARQAQAAQREQTAFEEARDLTQQQHQAYQQRVQEYEGAVTGQRQAVTTARAIPGQYGPETPARTLYNRFRDIAPDAQVPLTTLQETAAGVQQQVSRGFETVTPTRLQAVLDEVQRLPEVVDGLTAHRLMQDIGPLTRSPNSQIRGAAKQLYAGFQDALEKGAATLPETSEARTALLAANKAARREFALDDVQRILRRNTSRTPEGNVRFNAARTLDQLDRLYEEDKLFRGGWQPDEWQRLTSQVGELTQTPRMPGTRPGAAPAPVQPRATAPFEPRPFTEPAGRAPQPSLPSQEPLAEFHGQGPAAVPTLPPKGAVAKAIKGIAPAAGIITALTGSPGVGATVAITPYVVDVINALLITPGGQPYLRALLNPNGTINREVLIALAGGRAALSSASQGTATPQEAQQAVGTLRERYAP